eukprot:8457045-Pyramimonas_sp.AAC.1
MWEAANRTRRRMKCVLAKKAYEMTHFALAALRGVRARILQRVSDAVQCYCDLARFFGLSAGKCSSLPSLCDRIQTLQIAHLGTGRGCGSGGGALHEGTYACKVAMP